VVTKDNGKTSAGEQDANPRKDESAPVVPLGYAPNDGRLRRRVALWTSMAITRHLWRTTGSRVSKPRQRAATNPEADQNGLFVHLDNHSFARK
jgi:hypothetical protein